MSKPKENLQKRKVNPSIDKGLKDKSSKLKKRLFLFFSVILSFLIFSFVIFVLLFSIVVSNYYKNLPPVHGAVANNQIEDNFIYSRNGTLIATLYGSQNRVDVNYSQISPYMIKAMIAAEDVNFFKDKIGINIPSIIRSLYNDVFHKGVGVQGASTITQQLAKNTLLNDKRSVQNKIKEILLSIKLSQKYTKKQIITAYLNDVSFGGNIYGIEEASQTYFGEPASKLDIAQSALLAGMVQAPSVYSPYYGTDPALGIARQKYVLNQMMVHMSLVGLSKQQILDAENEKLTFHKSQSNITDPWFVYYVKQYLDQKYGSSFLNNGGLKIHTTLSLKLQNIAQNEVQSNVATFIRDGLNTHNSSLIAINPHNGHILAMVGSVNYNDNNSLVEGQVNSTLSLVSPGSSLKPFVYLTAFARGALTPNSYVYDTPLTIGNWSPTDWNDSYEGRITVATALLQSRNIPAVRVGLLIGLDPIYSTFYDVGLTQFTPQSISKCGYPALIGGCDISTLQEAQAYTTLANNGVFEKASPIDTIYNRNGKMIYNNQNPKGVRLFSPKYVEMVTSIIKSYYTMYPVIDAGYSVAGKTGTSNNHVDNIFAGYSPNLVSVVWSGNDNYSFTSNNTWGETTAALIWNDFMLKALKYYPNTKFNLSLWPYNYSASIIL
jgi:penicillin-binding protein 1A